MLLKFPAWKIVLVIGAVFLGIFFCIPNFFSEAGRAQYLSWFPTSAMKQGLDLKGGASILLEVDPDELRHNQLRQLNTRVRDALRARLDCSYSAMSISSQLLLLMSDGLLWLCALRLTTVSSAATKSRILSKWPSFSSMPLMPLLDISDMLL